MATLETLQKLMLRSRRTHLVVIGLTLLVLAATVVAGWLLARTLVRSQITQRDADLFYATTLLMEQLDARATDVRTDAQIGFNAAILASTLKGVMGIRFFDERGRFTDSFPATIQPCDLDSHTLRSVRNFEPVSTYYASIPFSDVFIYHPSFATGQVARVSVLEVTVPLHGREAQQLAGFAQFIVEGQSISEEYVRLDRHLAGLAGQTFVIAGVLLGVLLWLAFRRVDKLNRQLARQNEELVRANEELAMAARSSALGAVSAHLLHGLKNPLASLSQFVREHSAENGGKSDEPDDWRDALAASRRMQSLVEHTMEVIADSQGGPAYEISTSELVDTVKSRVASQARDKHVELTVQSDTDVELSSRTANLAGLVLTNLLENAVQATPSGKKVVLSIRCQASHLTFHVRDAGPGFPAHLRQRLFLPCKSTREGGSGIGLTISKQIADHLGATLELTEPDGEGCVFALSLPLEGSIDSTTSSNTTKKRN